MKAPVTKPAPLPGGSETILVVEDEDAVRRFVTRMLTRLGYNVLEASRGDVALELCRDAGRPIDLAIVDIVMPEMSGVEFVERLQQMAPGCRFLCMSGYPREAVDQYGALAREMFFIAKPFDMQGLARAVRQALAGSDHE